MQDSETYIFAGTELFKQRIVILSLLIPDSLKNKIREYLFPFFVKFQNGYEKKNNRLFRNGVLNVNANMQG